MVSIRFEASEAMYEEGGALFGSKQPDSLELGPFDYVQLTYDHLRVAPDGDPIGFFTDGRLWSVGVERIPLDDKWWSVGPAPDGLLFSDVVLHTEARASAAAEAGKQDRPDWVVCVRLADGSCATDRVTGGVAAAEAALKAALERERAELEEDGEEPAGALLPASGLFELGELVLRWAGPLREGDLERFSDAMGFSSVPGALSEIGEAIRSRGEEDARPESESG